MEAFLQQANNRRKGNARSLAAFGVASDEVQPGAILRQVREGGDVTLYTIGYERRTTDEFISLLHGAGIRILVDVRDKPVSRRAGFSKNSLRASCERAGIRYEGMPELGSTQGQRNSLRETGDMKAFVRSFRAYAARSLDHPIEQLLKHVEAGPAALLCYERDHDDCHRSILADIVAKRIDATVVAIV